MGDEVQKVFAERERAAGVDVHGTSPDVHRDAVCFRSRYVYPCRVDESVYSFKRPLERAHQFPDGFLVCAIQGGKDDIRERVAGPDLGADCAAGVRVEVGEGEAGAAFGEQEGDGSTDSGGGAAGVHVC